MQAGWLSGRQAIAYRQTCRQQAGETGRWADGQVNRQADQQEVMQAGRLADWLTGWLADWLTGCLAGWLASSQLDKQPHEDRRQAARKVVQASVQQTVFVLMNVSTFND